MLPWVYGTGYVADVREERLGLDVLWLADVLVALSGVAEVSPWVCSGVMSGVLLWCACGLMG